MECNREVTSAPAQKIGYFLGSNADPASYNQNTCLEYVVQTLNLRVTSPFLAMRQSNLSPAFFTVPEGSVVETSYELHQPGLVLIKLADQLLFAFMRDLRESAEPVDNAARFNQLLPDVPDVVKR
jgi:hypothetical protein